MPDPIEAEESKTIDENIYEYVEPPVPTRPAPSAATAKPPPPDAPIQKAADNRAADLRTRYALFKHSTFRPSSDHSTAGGPAPSSAVAADSSSCIEDAIEKQKLQLRAERESYEGAKTDEAVMLRLNALKRYPRISQLRGSSKTAAAFCLIAVSLS